MNHSYKRIGALLISIILSISAVGCGANTKEVSDQLKYNASDANQELVQSYNQFAMKLYAKIAEESKPSNIFVSPTSIATALSMTLNGAEGETLTAMQQSLELNHMTVDEINDANQILINLLQYADPSVELSIANSLWARQDKNFHTEFIDTNKDYYGAEVQELDFSKEASVDTINQWVQDSTNGKIEDIVENPIDPNTILFLINAIYFKGDWAHAFEESATRQSTFHLSDGTTQEVAMMSQENDFEYLNTDRFEAIRLPYGDEQWNMIVVLPHEEHSLSELYGELLDTPYVWTEGFEEMDGALKLPRFEMEYEILLNDTLKAIGMDIAFDKDRANFSGMADTPPNIFIENVKHKSFIEVNEQGTEAAAATSVEMADDSASESGFQMIVDRPFFFAIENRSTGALMFMGSVEQP